MPDGGRGSRHELTPDPYTVHTVSDLGRQLRILRLSAEGAPTMQAVAKRSGLPVSTIGNAESTRHLPRLDVVLRLAEACGAQAPVAAWRGAWQRAYLNRYPRGSQQSADEHSTGTVPAPRSRHRTANLLAAMPVGRALDRLLDMPLDSAVEVLEGMPIEAASAVLAAMEPRLAAERIAAMDPQPAADRLAAMDPQPAADRLAAMDHEIAEVLLRLQTPDDARRQLRCLSAVARGHTLTAMAPASVVQLISVFEPDEIGNVLRHMALRDAAAVLETQPALVTPGMLTQLTPERTALVFGELPPRWVSSTLERMAEPSCVLLLDEMAPVRAAAVLADMSTDRAADLVVRMTRDRAAAVLACMDALHAADLLTWFDDTDRMAADTLARMEPGRAVAVLAVWRGGAERRAALLATMEPTAAATVCAAMGPPSAAMLVSAMPAQRAVAVVSAMRPDLAASAMTAMDTEWAARLLAAMVPARAAVTLTAMAAPDAAGMLAAMEDPAKATRVLNEVDGTAAKAGLIVEVMRLAGVHAAVFLTLLGSDRAVPVLAALTDAQQAALLDAMQWETAQEMSNALARHRFRATGFTTP